MKILVVKLSSFGDVVHTLPLLADIAHVFPNATVDWVVDESYVPLLRWYQQQNPHRLNRVVVCSLRRWRRQFLHPKFYSSIKSEFRAFSEQLKQGDYDLILDVQGLIKSAWVARLARSTKTKIYGFKNGGLDSGYEPLARCVYDVSIPIPERIHAVSRPRYFFVQVCAQLGFESQIVDQISETKPEFCLRKSDKKQDRSNTRKALLVIHTAGKHKQWSIENWLGLANYLGGRDFLVEWSWGSQAEQAQSQQMITLSGGVLSKKRDLNQWCDDLSEYSLVIGVDTGLTHLAAALGLNTIELYVASWRWKTEGFWSENIVNLGDHCSPPTLDDVLKAIKKIEALTAEVAL